MSKTKTCNAKSNDYKESLTSDFKNPKQFWNKIKTIINTADEHFINQIRVANIILHDSLENRFIKLASQILMYPLADLFNLSLSTCELPTTWKFAHITPLHKGGNVLDPNNYRPISII